MRDVGREMRVEGVIDEGWAVYRPLAVSKRPRTASIEEMLTVAPYECVLPLLSVFACALVVGCRPSGPGRPLVVVASGDTAGWIAPCGCASNQSGGLPRRATYVERLRRQAEIVLVDVGGAAHGTSPYDLAKLEAILRGEALMGVAAHNIGAAEARFGPGELRRLAAKLAVPLLSANVCDSSARLVAAPVLILSVAGRRVALVGVLAERYATAEFQVTPPRQAVLDALRGAAGKYDIAIVLAYLPEDELRQLADALPEADAVVGGPTGQPISPKLVGPTLLCSATNKGKFLARLDAPALGSADRWTGTIIELNGQFADDVEQTANIDGFHTELARRDFTPGQTVFAEPMPADVSKGFAVAGTAACRKCHEGDCQLWRKSKHAAAWKALKEKGAHVDPECQRCHTTGYGLPGGFASAHRSVARAAVGCESCHGPSQGHVAEPAVRTAHFAQAKNHCMGCHDRENSPKFAYDTYWSKIVHGEQPAQPADASASVGPK
jgi:hypothetical protein